MKKLIQKKVMTNEYICPYCGHNFGIVDDYYFERVVGCQCSECNKEFDISEVV